MFRELSNASNEPFQLPSFETQQITARAIYAASINQLKRLCLAFRMSFQTASLSILSQTVLVYVANSVLVTAEENEKAESHFYLRLCLAALEDLYGSYREAWSVTRALLSMCLKRGAISPDEARRIKKEMIELGQHHDHDVEGETNSMMDLELATSDRSAAQAHRLANEFEEILLLSDAKESRSDNA
jgi:polyhydroxyalkanoate synthesis regulator phasin